MPSYLDMFDLDQKRRHLSSNTIEMRHDQIDRFQRETGTPLNASTTPEQIQLFLDSRIKPNGNPVSAKTRACYLTTFSSFYKWAIKHDLIEKNPVEKLDRPKVHQGIPNPIPESDLTRALAGAKPMMKCWIAFEAYAGLRCKEVCYLTHEDINVAENRIWVREGKGGYQRYVSGISPKILDALAQYIAPTATGRLWPSATPQSVSQRINRYYHSLGITHTAHKNRHRFGTMIFKVSGKNLLATQHALGHANVATTQIYTKVDNEDVENAVALL